jgi:hypothetical protein
VAREPWSFIPAERVAGHARRLGDGEAERSCQDLCRRLERAISTIGP